MAISPNDSTSLFLQEEAATIEGAALLSSSCDTAAAARILAFSSSSSSPAAAADREEQRSKSSSTRTRRHVVPQWQEAVAGASAGAFSRTAMAPLERIKLLQQLQGSLRLPSTLDKAIIIPSKTVSNSSNNPSAWSLARHVYQTEGLASFWRGNWPSCLRVSGTAAINFTCLEYYQAAAVRPLLDRFCYSNSSNTNSQRQAQFWSSLIAGGLAGATSTTILYPLEFVRTRLAVDLGTSETQQQKATASTGAPTATTTVASSSSSSTATIRPRQYRGMHHVFVDILRLDGIRGLYQGYGIALTGGIVYRVMYLGGYDAVKKEIQWQRDNKPIESGNSNTSTKTGGGGKPSSSSSSSSSTMTWTERFLVAQTISLTAGTLSYPFDSVRRRMMMQAGMSRQERVYRNSIHCIATVYGKEGVRGFYLGLAPNLVRSMGGALMLVAYDAVRGIL
jgi:solute carrier family 25 (mitochondrial adenine nucleotide translocator), member 4/5/6/31